MTFFNFIKNNKEWLFSGIGVVLIVGIITGFRDGIFQNDKHNDDNKYENSKLNGKSDISLDELIITINSKELTELQKANIYTEHNEKIVIWGIHPVNSIFTSMVGFIILVLKT